MSILDLTHRRKSLSELLTQEAVAARAEIRQGRFERSMALITAFASIVSGFEAYMQHTRGAFRDPLMWTPVGLTPPTVAAAGAAVVSREAARRVLPFVSLASLVDGVVGFIYHLRGVQRLPGGFKLGQYNIVMGPPIFAPLLMSIVGLLGLLASGLRRERLEVFEQGIGWDDRLVSTAEAVAAKALPAANPLQQAERQIAHGRFQRWMALMSAGFAVLAGGEAYFEHLRGSFNQRWMWTPVWVSLPMAMAGIGAMLSERVACQVLPITSAASFLDGLLGFALHLRGIKRMPGHFFNLQFNITMGPPLFAPLLFSAVGLLGFIASLLRRREGR